MSAAMEENRATHAHMPPSGDRRALVISGWLTGTYFLIELAIGLWTGSVAVTSDAFHTFSAVGGVLIALFALRLSERPSSLVKTFGYARAEILGAMFNGLFLALMALFVFWMGAMRLMDPIHLPTTPMLAAAAGGIVTEAVALWLMYGRQKGNLNLRGAFWHVIQTFVGSLLIIITALVIRFTGFLAIDPILGMTFGVVLLWASWVIIRDSLQILLQSTPAVLDLEEAISAILNIEGVTDVHHVHAWSLTSGKALFSAHVCVPDPALADRVLGQATTVLHDRFGIYFSTLQIEQTCRDDIEGAEEIDVMRKSEAGQSAGRGAGRLPLGH